MKSKMNLLFQILHALGLFHEHQRPDRDQYIDVDMKTVSALGFYDDFKKACFLEFKTITTSTVELVATCY